MFYIHNKDRVPQKTIQHQHDSLSSDILLAKMGFVYQIYQTAQNNHFI